MPRLVITRQARIGLQRCRLFLADKNPAAQRRAASVIDKQLALVKTSPLMGRPLEASTALRELIIGFGDSGYVALYRYMEDEEAVYVLAFRHQKEAGYYTHRDGG